MMAKRPGALVLSFSKRNVDIRKLLESKKANDENFIVTDYICQSIRFYEKYRDSLNQSNKEEIKRLIDDRLKQFFQANNAVTLGLAETTRAVEETVMENEIKTDINSLEKDIDDISVDED